MGDRYRTAGSQHRHGVVAFPQLNLKSRSVLPRVPRPQEVCLPCPPAPMRAWLRPCFSFSADASCFLSVSPSFQILICCGHEHVLKVVCKLEVNGCAFLLTMLSKWAWREEGLRGVFRGKAHACFGAWVFEMSLARGDLFPELTVQGRAPLGSMRLQGLMSQRLEN